MNKKNTPKGVIIMSTFKRILSFVLARVMVAGMLLARAVATETEPTAAEESIPETIPEETVPVETAGENVIETAVSSIVDSGRCGTGLTWMLTKNGTLTISGSGQMLSFDVTVKPS